MFGLHTFCADDLMVNSHFFRPMHVDVLGFPLGFAWVSLWFPFGFSSASLRFPFVPLISLSDQPQRGLTRYHGYDLLAKYLEHEDASHDCAVVHAIRSHVLQPLNV